MRNWESSMPDVLIINKYRTIILMYILIPSDIMLNILLNIWIVSF